MTVTDRYLVMEALTACLADWDPTSDKANGPSRTSAAMYYQTEDVYATPPVYHTDPNPPRYTPPSPGLCFGSPPSSAASASSAQDSDIPCLSLDAPACPPQATSSHDVTATEYQFCFECPAPNSGPTTPAADSRWPRPMRPSKRQSLPRGSQPYGNQRKRWSPCALDAARPAKVSRRDSV
ncbi:hypothetical protein H4R34_001026 [Dimargaris verticillata]|uniref:Uncharacterized protein n=1 Tax=Dimargaris verticillata TaxID=2761393 RepID=A0A9W8EAP9_9FUNG|nr:hypothetical protein H4R34_001026 [Dimargaris verticillata]